MPRMGSSHATLDCTRARRLTRELAAQQARLAEAHAAPAESRQAHAAATPEIQRNLNERLTKAQNDLAQIEQQGSKGARREQLTRLTAPVAVSRKNWRPTDSMACISSDMTGEMTRTLAISATARASA